MGRSRDTRSHLLELSLCSVRPDPESEPHLEEQRLELALLPVRLRLDKGLLQFLQVGEVVQNWCDNGCTTYCCSSCRYVLSGPAGGREKQERYSGRGRAHVYLRAELYSLPHLRRTAVPSSPRGSGLR